MRFTPKSANEIAKAGLLPDGDYDFEVLSAEDAISKSNNEMIALKLKVFNGDGGSVNVLDWLVGTEASIRKVRQFSVAVGMLNEYESGDMPAEAIVGTSGRAKIKTNQQGDFEPRNGVAYYLDPAKQTGVTTVRRTPMQPARQQAPAGGDLDDEIPF